MSQRPSSRNLNSQEQRTTRTRSSESCRNTGRSRTTDCRVNEPIQEEQLSQEECEFEFPEQEPRYDPKELRDAAKILSPFLRLIEDTNNPYARIVTREVCKTFYHLFHPGMHPVDVIKSINWATKSERNHQLWNEFWQYVPGARIKEWSSLKPKKLKNPNKGCRPCPTAKIEQNLFDISFPDDGCEFDFSGPLNELDQLVEEAARNNCYADTVPTDQRSCVEGENRASEQSTTSKRHSAGNDGVYQLPFCPPGPSSWYPSSTELEYYRNAANASLPVAQIQNESWPDSERENTLVGSENLDDSWDYDTSEFESSVVSVKNVNAVCNKPESDDSWDYNTDEFESSVVGGKNVNAACNIPERDENATDTAECNATLLANAYANLSLAEQDVQRKRDAFNFLTQSYLEKARNSIEKDLECSENPTGKGILQAIYQNPPRILKPFDDCEWNDNAFRDRDFIRLLPFFENFHNQLEHVSNKQREFGIDMLDDVMSVLYHIHYDLGDPRLKNDMLKEHVKLITANTWEKFFYLDDRRMPQVPEVPSPRSPPRVDVEQPILPQPGPSSRRSSVGSVPPPPIPPPKKTPPPTVKPAPKAPKHNRPSGHGVMSPENKPVVPVTKQPTAAAKRRPQTSTNPRKSNDAPETSSDACPPPEEPERKTNFLRRSKPSGNPKKWAPKSKSRILPKTDRC